MATQQIIGQGLDWIGVRFFISRAYGMEGQEFASVAINGKRYRNCVIGNDGVLEGIVEWMNEEVLHNEAAQQILKTVHDSKEYLRGSECIKLDAKDGKYKVWSFGENGVFALLREFGIKLKTVKSSSRRNAVLVGYDVTNNGVEVADVAA